MKLLFYGRLADLIGREHGLSPERACTVAEIRAEIALLHPAAAGELGPERARAFVNDALAGEDMVVAEGDEIAFLPPLSGG
jgi:molybdopterin synthase sulfur carrier subunit